MAMLAIGSLLLLAVALKLHGLTIEREATAGVLSETRLLTVAAGATAAVFYGGGLAETSPDWQGEKAMVIFLRIFLTSGTAIGQYQSLMCSAAASRQRPLCQGGNHE